MSAADTSNGTGKAPELPKAGAVLGPPGPIPSADTRTLAQRITGLLRDAIIDGALPAGYPLRQEELASRFGISRIPLREALRQLEAEGFVQIAAYRGATVRSISATEIRQIMEIRIAVESLALDLAIPRITDARLDQLERIAAQLGRETDPRRFTELHTEFFLGLYEACEIPLLLEVIRLVIGHAQRYARVCLPELIDGRMPITSLAELLAACRRRDPLAAKQALTWRLHQAAELTAAKLATRSAGEV